MRSIWKVMLRRVCILVAESRQSGVWRRNDLMRTRVTRGPFIRETVARMPETPRLDLLLPNARGPTNLATSAGQISPIMLHGD